MMQIEFGKIHYKHNDNPSSSYKLKLSVKNMEVFFNNLLLVT